MSDELLPFYERELKYLTELGAEFAARHPQAAQRLKLGAEGTADPHVERLIQAVALLNARVRHKLDDDFPELTESLLGVLYPHYLRPVPSLAIAQFELDASQHELLAGHTVPRGTAIESEPDQLFGEVCRYRTAYDLTLFPLRVAHARLARRPAFAVPNSPRASRAQAALHVRLKTFAPATTADQLALPKLRLHLHRGNNTNVHKLLELLLTDVLEVCLAPSPTSEHFVTLPKEAIGLVGFERNEKLLPADPRTFPGYGMLTEYFAFPQKHLFVDLQLGDPGQSSWALAPLRGKLGDTLELFFLLRRGDAELEHDLSADTLRLGCTPIVNLFSHSEASELRPTGTEHHVIPGDGREQACEVYSIDAVEGVTPQLTTIDYQPFFSWKHGAGTARQAYWHAAVRPGAASDPAAPDRRRQEFFLSLVDAEMRPTALDGQTLRIKATCHSGEAPGNLPVGTGPVGVPRPLLNLPDGAGPIGRAVCLSPPTPTQRPQRRQGALWRLISHLSLNHLSLVEGDRGAAALREVLQLYNFRQSAETQALIDSLVEIETDRVVRRVGWKAGGFGLGIHTRLTIDESRLSGMGYLLGAVLDRFLGLFVAVNSFSELVVQSKQRLGQEDPWSWPKRSGEKVLL